MSELTECRQSGYGAERVPRGMLNICPPLIQRWSVADVHEVPIVTIDRIVATGLASDGVGFIVCLGLDGTEIWRRTAQYEGLSMHEALLVGTRIEGRRKSLVRLDYLSGREMSVAQSPFGIRLYLPEQRAFLALEVVEQSKNDVFVSIVRLNSDDDAVQWKVTSRGHPASRISSETFDFDLAADGTSVFVGKGNSFVALDVENGRQVWTTELSSPGLCAWRPAVSNGVLLVDTTSGTSGLCATNGKVLWRTPRRALRSVYGGRVYSWTSDGKYSVLDVVSGREVLSVDVSADIQRRYGFEANHWGTAPAVSETHVLVGENNGRVWAIERETGMPIWSDKPNGVAGFIGGCPLILSHRAYFVSRDIKGMKPTRLYCYEEQAADGTHGT